MSAAPTGEGFGTEALIYLIVFGLPSICSSGCPPHLQGRGRQLQGVLAPAAPGPRCPRGAARGPCSPTWPAYEGPAGRSARSWTSPGSRTGRPGRARCGAGGPDGRAAGTGKTLPARAGPGEAEVPFFSVAGSSFVDCSSASARPRPRPVRRGPQRGQAIIFIDEIDAIGQRRAGQGAIVSNDEREQTLNQPPADTDGFEPTAGVVLPAATNRPRCSTRPSCGPAASTDRSPSPAERQRSAPPSSKAHCPGQEAGPDVDLARWPGARLGLRRRPGQPGRPGGDFRRPR